MQHASSVTPSPTAERTGPQRHLTPDDVAAITEAGSRGGTFVCTLCNKKFGYKNGLIRHVRLTHVGEKPYQCNICQRRFGYKHILMEHQNLHFGNRPYACALCDKKFAARSNLIQHRLVHKRPYHCQLCNKRFDRDDQLKKHLFAHPQSRLTCNFCQYTASGQADLNRHMVELHSPAVLDTRSNGTPRKTEHILEEADTTDVSSMAESVLQPEGIPNLTPPSDSPRSQTSTTPSTSQFLQAAGMSTTSSSPSSSSSRGLRVENICLQLKSGETDRRLDPADLENTDAFLQGVTIKKEIDDLDSCGRSACSQSPRTPSRTDTSLFYSVAEPSQGPATSAHVFSTPSCLPLSSASANVAPVAALPGIHEVFTRRPQRAPPPNFNNLSTSPMLSGSDLPLPMFSNTNPFPPSVNANNNRPTAQLPPIAQVFRQTKPKLENPPSPPNGIPALEEVLSYYISHGKLFRCCHCNILFYERGMYFLHASLHGTNSPWECSICHKLCSDKNEFTLHFVNQQHTAWQGLQTLLARLMEIDSS